MILTNYFFIIYIIASSQNNFLFSLSVLKSQKLKTSLVCRMCISKNKGNIVTEGF